jgi:hypothetical protein
MVDANKRALVDKLLEKSLSHYIRGMDDALWRENPEVFKERIDELDSALVPGFGFGGHKIAARYEMAQAELAIKRAKIVVIVAAALPYKTKDEKAAYKAAMKDAKKVMRDAADRMAGALETCVYRGEI